MSTEERVRVVHPFAAQFVEHGGWASENAPAWLMDFQKVARQKITSLTAPSRKQEEWKFIKIDSILKAGYLRNEAVPHSITTEQVSEMSFGDEVAARLVFVNGAYSQELSSIGNLPEGTIISDWSSFAATKDTGLVEEVLGSVDYWEEDLFYQVNNASFRDGAVIIVPRNQVVEAPVHLLFVNDGREGRFASHPRNLFIAGESAEITIVEEHLGREGEYFSNVVDEVHVGANATMRHVKVQRESEAAYHVARNLIRLKQDSNYVGTALNFGAALSRNDSYAYYDGENIDCTLDGLAHLQGTQVSDTHTAIDHRLPNSRSYQLHKTVVDDRAHSVFNGKIFVRQDAQQTRSEQLNQNLVLSKKAHVDTKPQLEILADDVICSHGATVGQMEEEQAFYLSSRGIGSEQARAILTFAFAAEVLETITVDALRRELERELLQIAE